MLVNQYYVLLRVTMPVLYGTQLQSQLLFSPATPKVLPFSESVSFHKLTMAVGTGRIHLCLKIPTVFLSNFI